jgi:hypothetical protein
MLALLAWALWLAAPSLVWAAYLPSVGPGPIRLKPKPKPFLASVLHEPVPSAETNGVSISVATNLVKTTNSPETITVKSPLPLGGVAGFPGDPSQGLPPINGTPESPTVTPQMLVPFFHQPPTDKGGAETQVVLPLIFAPPALVPKPGGKATYTAP